MLQSKTLFHFKINQIKFHAESFYLIQLIVMCMILNIIICFRFIQCWISNELKFYLSAILITASLSCRWCSFPIIISFLKCRKIANSLAMTSTAHLNITKPSIQSFIDRPMTTIIWVVEYHPNEALKYNELKCDIWTERN